MAATAANAIAFERIMTILHPLMRVSRMDNVSPDAKSHPADSR